MAGLPPASRLPCRSHDAQRASPRAHGSSLWLDPLRAGCRSAPDLLGRFINSSANDPTTNEKSERMFLPRREDAYIPPSKIDSYLLSKTHAVGKSKAKFFRTLGFNEGNTNLLEQGLLAIARSEVVKETASLPYGTKYIIDGSLTTPNGKSVNVRTIWIIEAEDEKPRFVTAYPD